MVLAVLGNTVLVDVFGATVLVVGVFIRLTDFYRAGPELFLGIT